MATTQSWYNDFKKNLHNMGTRASINAMPISSPRMLPSPTIDTSNWSKNSNSFGEHLMDWGGRALDLISRPGYATGGFLNTLLENNLDANDKNDENPFESAWQGFLGHEKEFFRPVSTIDPYEEGESGFETAGRFIGDLLGAIGTDPLTYVGPGAVRQVGKLTGLDKVGQGIKKGAQVKNAPLLTPADEIAAGDLATDTERLRETLNKSKVRVAPQDDMIQPVVGGVRTNTPQLPAMGPNKTLIENMPVLSVNDTAGLKGQALIDRLLQEPTLKKGVVGELDSPLAQQGVSQVAKNLRYSTGRPADDLAMLTILRSGIAENLRGIRARTHKAGDFESPWEDKLVTEAIARPEKRTFPEIPKPQGKVTPGKQIPGTPVEVQANRDAVIRYEWQHTPDLPTAAKAKAASKADQAYAAHGDDIYLNGKKIGSDGLDTIKKHLDETRDYSDISPINAEPIGIEFSGGELTAGQYASALKQGVEKPFLADSAVPVRDDILGLNDYITSRSQTYKERAKGTRTKDTVTDATPEELAAYEKAVATQTSEKAAYEAAIKEADDFLPTFESVRPDTESRRAWLSKHREKLTQQDIKKLNESMYRGSEKQFNKILDDIITRESALDTDAIDVFNQAVADGRVSKEDAKAIWAKFGARGPADAKRRIESVDARIEKLKEKLAPEIAAKADEARTNLVPASRKAAVKMAEANPLKVPKTPKKFFDFHLKRESFAFSELNEFKTAMEDIVSPEILNQLSPQHAELLSNTMREALKDPYLFNRQNLPKLTNRMKTNNDLEIYNTFREVNEKTQYSFWKQLMGQIKKDMPAGLKGKTGENARAPYVYDQAMPVLKALDQMMRAYGVHPSITAGGKGLPLSLHDVLSSLPRKQAEKYFFDRAAGITPSQWLHIAEEAFYTTPKNLDDAIDIVSLTLRETDEALSYHGSSVWSGENAAKNTRKKQAKQGKTGENYERNADIRGAHVQEKAFKKGLTEIITPEFIRRIKDLVAYNSRRAEIQTGQFIQETSDKVIQKFVDDLAEINTQQELLSLVQNASKGVPGFVKASNVVPPPGAAAEVADQVALVTRSNPGTEIAAKESEAYKAANDKGDVHTAGQKQAQAVEDRVRDMIPVHDFTQRLELNFWGQVAHHVFPHMQEDMLRHVMLSGQNIAGEWSKNFSRSLSDFEQAIGFDKSKQIWSDIQHGIGAPASQKQHYDKMEQIISEVFDVARRSGLDPAHINSNLSKFKLDKAIFSLKGKTWDEAYDSWKHWGDLEDPLNTMSRMYAAVQKTRVEKEMFDRFALDFGSHTMKPGYGRIVSSGGSRVGHLIDKRLYYPTEIINNLRALDKTMIELAKTL
jgi:hypothetical protein